MRVCALIFAATALPLPVMAQPWRQSCGYGSDQSCVTINFQLTMPLERFWIKLNRNPSCGCSWRIQLA
jgi:hypothetical protein